MMKSKCKAEHKIFKRICRYGGATVFWITQNQTLAEAMDDLEAAGRVIRQREHPCDRYPFCVYEVKNGIGKRGNDDESKRKSHQMYCNQT